MKTLTQRLGIKKIDEFLDGNIEPSLDIYLENEPTEEVRRVLFKDISRQLRQMFPQLEFVETENSPVPGESNPQIDSIPNSIPYGVGFEVRYMTKASWGCGLLIKASQGRKNDMTKQFLTHYKGVLVGEAQ